MNINRSYPRVFNLTYGSASGGGSAETQSPQCYPWFSFMTLTLTATAQAGATAYKSQRPDGKCMAYFISTDVEWSSGANATFVPKRQKIENEYALSRDWLLRTWGTGLLVGMFGSASTLNICGARDANGDIPAVGVFRAYYNTYYSNAVAPALDGVYFDGPITYPAGQFLSRPYPDTTAGYGKNAAGGSTTLLVLPAAIPSSTAVLGRFVNFISGFNAGERRKINSSGSLTQVGWASALPSSLVTVDTANFIISGYESVGVTTFGANTATDPSANWTGDEWAGGWVQCGLYLRQIVSNTSTTLTLFDPWIQGTLVANPVGGTIFEIQAAPNVRGGDALSAIDANNKTLFNMMNPFNNADFDGASAMPQNGRSSRYAITALARGKELVQQAKAIGLADGRTEWYVGGNGPLACFAGMAQLEDYTFNEGAFVFGAAAGLQYNKLERANVAHEMLAKTQYVGPIGAAVALPAQPSVSVALNSVLWTYNRSMFCACQMTDNWFAINGVSYVTIPYQVLNEVKLPTGSGGWGSAIDGPQSDVYPGKTYWRREFENVLVIWNPSTSSVTVIENGWKKFSDAVLFAATPQGPVINDGGPAGGGGFSLGADEGIVLVRV